MPAFHETFRVGHAVRIRGQEALNQLIRDRIGIIDEQLNCAGQSAIVSSVGYHFAGGIVMHHLKYSNGTAVPGWWPENCLDDETWFEPAWWGWPRASEYFQICTVERRGHWYVVVADHDGVECLVLRCIDENDALVLADAISDVAARLHLANFQRRYGFQSTFDWGLQTRFVRYLGHANSKVVNVEKCVDVVRVHLLKGNGDTICIAFECAVEVERLRPEGMSVFDIAECDYKDDRRLFHFINMDQQDPSRLVIAATSMNDS